GRLAAEDIDKPLRPRRRAPCGVVETPIDADRRSRPLASVALGLCRKCDKQSTGKDDAREHTEAIMPGKKAHKNRIVQNAGMHGSAMHTGHGRGSNAQTEGQYSRDIKRRRGQFTSAGDPPLMKK